jgi:hypothetical protein
MLVHARSHAAAAKALAVVRQAEGGGAAVPV